MIFYEFPDIIDLFFLLGCTVLASTEYKTGYDKVGKYVHFYGKDIGMNINQNRLQT